MIVDSFPPQDASYGGKTCFIHSRNRWKRWKRTHTLHDNFPKAANPTTSTPASLSLSLPNSSKSSLPSLNWELERIIVSRNINERNKQHATSDECESLVLKEEWKHVRIEFDTSEGHHGILNFPLSYRLPIMAKVINKIK